MLEKKQDKLIAHSILLLAATQVVNVANMLFQMSMGRMLDPIEYGNLTAMLNIVLMFGQPLEALRTAVAHFAARLAQVGHVGDIKALSWNWTRRILVLAIPALILGTLFAHQIADMFKLASPGPVYITALTIFLACFMPIVTGALHGIQAFIWMTVVSQGWGVVRLLAGVGMVWFIGREAFWALTGQMIGVALSTVLGVAALWIILAKEPRTNLKRPWREYRYFIMAFIALSGYAVLMNADVPFVKYYFSPEQAGNFAYAAVLGRTIIFLPMPIAGALFPKVVSEGETTRGDWVTMVKAVGIAAIIIVGAACACVLLPGLALRILFGITDPTPELIKLVRVVVLAMSPLGMTFLLTNFELAQHRFSVVPILLGCAACYVVGVAVWHATILQIMAVLACSSTLSMLLLIANLPWKSMRGEQAA